MNLFVTDKLGFLMVCRAYDTHCESAQMSTG